MNDFFNIKVSIQKEEEKSIIGQNFYTGQLTISARETIEVEQIKGQLLLKMKGRMSTFERQIDKFFISNSIKKLIKNESYQFSFDFQYTSDLPTFKGQNFSSLYEIVFEFDFDKENYEKLNKGILSSISTFFTGKRNYKHVEYITFEQENTQFEVVESDDELDLKYLLFMTFIIAIPLILICFGLLF